jgi:hypothetical protein
MRSIPKSRGFRTIIALSFHVGARLAKELFPGQFKMPEKMFFELLATLA